jgi:GntR family transcriptional regulator
MDLRVDRQSGLPLGHQLVERLRSQIASGALQPGDRLPSVRDAAVAAGVNVNTVRAAYGRLVSSQHGRGTFVAPPAGAHDDARERRELRRQIAALELELARRPPSPSEAEQTPRPAPRPTLLSTAELAGIRDDLHERLRELDAERAELLQRLHELPAIELEEAPASRSSPSRIGARVRWVGA